MRLGDITRPNARSQNNAINKSVAGVPGEVRWFQGSQKALKGEDFEGFTRSSAVQGESEGIVTPAENCNEESLAPRQLYQTLFAIPQVRGTLFSFILLSYKIHSIAYFSTRCRCCLLCSSSYSPATFTHH